MINRKNAEELIKFSPDLLRIIIKLIKYAKGGLDKEERQELGADLLELASKILEEVMRLRDMSPLWEMMQEGVDLKSIQWAEH